MPTTQRNIEKIEIEFAILWDDQTWENCNFEECEIDLNNYKHCNNFSPTPQYFEDMCKKYEFLRNSKLSIPLEGSIAKVVVYSWRWLD